MFVYLFISIYGSSMNDIYMIEGSIVLIKLIDYYVGWFNYSKGIGSIISLLISSFKKLA